MANKTSVEQQIAELTAAVAALASLQQQQQQTLTPKQQQSLKSAVAAAAALITLPANVNGCQILAAATKSTAAGGDADKSVCWRGTGSGVVELDGREYAADYTVLVTLRGSKNWR